MSGGALYNMKKTYLALRYFPIDRAIVISGDHGIGKSSIVKQVCNDMDIPCLDFRLSQNDVGDLKGMPFHVKGRTFFAPPDWFPLKEADRVELKDMLNLTDAISSGRFGDRGILFLDEINRANIEVQQAAFELVLDRRLNMRALPDGWRVVSAINGNDAVYKVTSMEPAFLSRFFLIDLRPTFEEWLEWASGTGNVHPVVVDFLKRNPDLLDPTEESLKDASLNGVVKVNDRRAWDFLSQTIRELEDVKVREPEFPYEILKNDPDNLSYLLETASGYVGMKVATKFQSFVESDYQALDADAILNKFDEEVEKRLKESVDKMRQTELTAYNEMLIEYIDKHVKDKLNKTQDRNLSRYLGMIGNELVSSFWQKFNGDCKVVSEAWYVGDNKEIILKAVLNPKARKAS